MNRLSSLPFVLASRWLPPIVSLLMGVLLFDATARAQSAPQTKPISVVTTTSMIADLARNIGGDRLRVTALMGEGVDPHTYKASASDMRTLADADLILYNGLHLEGRMADALVRLAARTSVVQVTDTIPEDRLREPPEFKGNYDPHVWFDVQLWCLVAERVRDALIARDPAGKDHYTAKARTYVATLHDLDAFAKEQIARLPKESRLLVTAHDAFGYFGRAYGIEVRAIQGISTDSEASLRDIRALVDMLVERKVPAVFVESSVPRKTIEALVEGCKARGHDVRIGGELFSDSMGKAGTPQGTYVGMVRHNVETIARALSPSESAPDSTKEGR